MDGTSFRHQQRRRRYCNSNMRSEEGNPLMSRANGLCLKTNIGSLSDDLLFQILQLLPADFLYEKARFVCCRWYEIIHSEDFTNAQIRRSTYGLLLLPIPDSYPIFVTAISGQIQAYKLSYKCRTRYFHTCNGLLVELLHYHSERAAILKVVNPATKQQFLVPPLPMLGGEFYKQECHIAYSAASKVYKLVLEYFDEDDENRAGVKIVTARVDKSWRNVPIHHLSDDLTRVVAETRAVVSEGFLHWVGKRRVLTLNVETETFTYSETPESYPCKVRPLSGGRYLSVLCGGRGVWEVWEMKPESGEWRNLLPLMIDWRQFASEHRELHYSPLGWVKYPEVLAFRCWSSESRTCHFYNLVTHKIDSVDLHHSNQSVYRASPHINNFAWLS